MSCEKTIHSFICQFLHDIKMLKGESASRACGVLIVKQLNTVL